VEFAETYFSTAWRDGIPLFMDYISGRQAGLYPQSSKLREGHIQITSKDGLIFLHAIRDPSDGKSNKIKSTPPNQYDWSARAIQGGCTSIDHRELRVPHPSKPC
jgi:hypothetical protein